MEEAESILCAVEQSDDTQTGKPDENMGERRRVGDKMQARDPFSPSQGNKIVERLRFYYFCSADSSVCAQNTGN